MCFLTAWSQILRYPHSILKTSFLHIYVFFFVNYTQRCRDIFSLPEYWPVSTFQWCLLSGYTGKASVESVKPSVHALAVVSDWLELRIIASYGVVPSHSSPEQRETVKNFWVKYTLYKVRVRNLFPFRLNLHTIIISYCVAIIRYQTKWFVKEKHWNCRAHSAHPWGCFVHLTLSGNITSSFDTWVDFRLRHQYAVQDAMYHACGVWFRHPFAQIVPKNT